MKRFILWAAIFSLPFQSKAQVISPTIQEDTFQSNTFWDLGTKGLGNINADDYFLPAYNADLYVTTWDGGDPVADIKYGGFVVRQYPFGTLVHNNTVPTFQKSQSAFPIGDFNGYHISSLEAGFFQFSGETYIALTYFGIDYATPSSGYFYIDIYK